MMDALHTAAYFILVVVFVARMFRLPASFNALIGLHRWTQVAGLLSSLLLAVGFFGSAIGERDALVFLITDWGIAVSSVAFLIGLAMDVNASLKNLRIAFKLAQDEFGSDGDRMIALVTQALRRGR